MPSCNAAPKPEPEPEPDRKPLPLGTCARTLKANIAGNAKLLRWLPLIADGRTPGNAMARAHCRILLIEDDPSLREALVRVMRGSGYEVVAMKSAEEMQSRLGEQGLSHDYGCVICDVRLPGISGLELRRRIAEHGRLPPWIYISAFDDICTRHQVERDGAALLQKPFTGKTLLALVAQHVAEGRRPA